MIIIEEVDWRTNLHAHVVDHGGCEGLDGFLVCPFRFIEFREGMNGVIVIKIKLINFRAYGQFNKGRYADFVGGSP